MKIPIFGLVWNGEGFFGFVWKSCTPLHPIVNHNFPKQRGDRKTHFQTHPYLWDSPLPSPLGPLAPQSCVQKPASFWVGLRHQNTGDIVGISWRFFRNDLGMKHQAFYADLDGKKWYTWQTRWFGFVWKWENATPCGWWFRHPLKIITQLGIDSKSECNKIKLT